MKTGERGRREGLLTNDDNFNHFSFSMLSIIVVSIDVATLLKHDEGIQSNDRRSTRKQTHLSRTSRFMISILEDRRQ
jgi:hypothetical protein